MAATSSSLSPPPSGQPTDSLPSPGEMQAAVRPVSHRRFKPGEVDRALSGHKGNRAKAAAQLKISIQSLEKRIKETPWLALKWSRKARIAAEDANIDRNPLDPVVVIEQMIDQHNIALDLNSERILNQLRKIERRIELGETALLEPDNGAAQNFRFRTNERGEPTEEKMLREQYAVLLAEFRETMEECAKQVFMKAKIIKEMRGGRPSKPNQNRPGFVPKGQTQIVAQAGSTFNLKS